MRSFIFLTSLIILVFSAALEAQAIGPGHLRFIRKKPRTDWVRHCVRVQFIKGKGDKEKGFTTKQCDKCKGKGKIFFKTITCDKCGGSGKIKLYYFLR